MITFLFQHYLLSLSFIYLVIGAFVFWLSGEHHRSAGEMKSLRNVLDTRKLAYRCLVLITGIFLWPFLLTDLWSKRKQSRRDAPIMTLQRCEELAGSLIMQGYRRIYAQAGIGASPEVPDAVILDIYERVGSAFRAVSETRGELLTSGTINNIVLHFLELYRTRGGQFVGAHLEYECAKYQREGLREDYTTAVHLF